jgi:beta-glucanase (GH16 family)
MPSRIHTVKTNIGLAARPLHASMLAFCLLLASTTVTAQDLLWSDEFDAGSQPNPDVWSYDLGTGQNGWGNWELQEYTDSEQNVRIENGTLIITAMPKMAGDEVVGFTSARIKTQDKLQFRYARIEARIRTPDLERGLWPAFWTLGSNFPEVGWPACGELDILEMGMLDAISAGPGLVNEWVASAAHWQSGGNYAIYNKTLKTGINLAGEFHILTMDWTPTLVRTYLDGEEIWAMDISSANCNDCEEFHRPHFAILNMAVGGTFTGMRSIGAITAPLPASLEVDWVRIYDNGYTELSGPALGAPDIGPAHSGSWYNDDQSGHGFSMEFVETDSGPLAVIYWYTYDDQGNPIFLLGTGVPDGNKVDVVFESPVGMIYGEFDPLTVSREDGGTGSFEFLDRDNAIFSYTPSEFTAATWGHTEPINALPLVKLVGIAAEYKFNSQTR